jgi:hypothetical protein
MLRVSVSKGKGKEKDEEETLRVHLPSAKRQFNAVLYGDMVQKGFAHLYGGTGAPLPPSPFPPLFHIQFIY